MNPEGRIITGAVQVIVVLMLSPLMVGILKKIEARIESRSGISIFQPYYDLAKFFRKETLIPEGVGPFFIMAPFIAFGAMLTLPWVLPIVGNFPSWFAPTVDFFGGTFIFGLAAMVLILATERTGSYYTGIGATRAVSFGAFAEPVLIMVFFGVAILTGTNNPFLMNHRITAGGWYLSPTHILITAAFFMLLLFDTGKLPIESHGVNELGMLEQGKGLEYTGPLYALNTWAGYMKSFILMAVFLNVFAVPWGLATNASLYEVLKGIFLLFVKMLGLIGAFVVIEETLAKIRLFRIIDYLSTSFLLAIMGVISFLLGGGAP
ncbi:respiratory chain complex I subunit 1 family protein [Thermococcus sp.]|uniref:respiratory chain complex I subunit 1 family protein n=1 Tax=Thermococcus sp. TaxID=35749 RepID=UPI0025FA2B0E|nr:NADH-quinone oxidoreductase subunit H [Thermococcus sp.]